jgi:hypothetical protein
MIMHPSMSAPERERNARQAAIKWPFTARHAPVKLKNFYPVAKAQLD